MSAMTGSTDCPPDRLAAVLWPAHFDVGMTAAAVNYGASPGDEHITEPYPYAGPRDGPPPGDPAFWNAPFGAARTFRQIGTVAGRRHSSARPGLRPGRDHD
jgi:hypothetical protein